MSEHRDGALQLPRAVAELHEAPVEGLTSLEKVLLSNNQLSGSIPEKLFEGLTSLKKVHLEDNQLSGPIPESLRAVVKL